MTDRTPPMTARSRTSPYAGGADLRRTAELIARGELPIPGQLPAADVRRLVDAVSRERRDRLVDYIARAIALDIYRASQDAKVLRHAETHL